MACKDKCKPPIAALANRQVELYKFVETGRDSVGGIVREWSLIRTIWCQIKTIRGWERLRDYRVNEEVDMRFITDFMNVSDLKAATDRTEWKLRYEGVDYNITFLDDVDEQHKVVEIFAKKGIDS